MKKTFAVLLAVCLLSLCMMPVSMATETPPVLSPEEFYASDAKITIYTDHADPELVDWYRTGDGVGTFLAERYGWDYEEMNETGNMPKAYCVHKWAYIGYVEIHLGIGDGNCELWYNEGFRCSDCGATQLRSRYVNTHWH